MDIYDIASSKTWKTSLKKKYFESRIVNDWIQFDLDLMRFNSKHLENNLKQINTMLPNLPSDEKVAKWYREEKKYSAQIKDFLNKKEKRDKILGRYPNLEKRLIQWREEYRVERIERLRAKRDKLTAEIPYIPERQKDVAKWHRRKMRADRRAKFEEDNKKRRQKLQTTIKRTKGDDLSDTDTDPENEHLSRWSELEELPDLAAGHKKHKKGKGNMVNLAEEKREKERLERIKKGLPPLPGDEVKMVWRYRNGDELQEKQEAIQKLKNDIWYFSCRGWFERFRHFQRVAYNPETNSFDYYKYEHDNIFSKDYVDPPILTDHEKAAIRKEEKEKGIKPPSAEECYLNLLAPREANKPFYAPFFFVDLSEAWLEDFEDRDFDAELELKEKTREEYKINRKEKLALREKTHKRKLNEEEKYTRMVRRLREKVSKSHSEYDLDSILQRIPGFKFKFTKAQLQMINKSKKRTIVIGRSGTGKSTCAILKMLAIDLLFIGKKVLKSKRTKVEAADMTSTGIKHLFLTSSRVLADDLRVFYENLLVALKEKLLGRELKKTVTVEKVVEVVEQMEEDPEKFVKDLGVTAPATGDVTAEGSEIAENNPDEPQDEISDEKLEDGDGEITENKLQKDGESEGSDASSQKSESSDDDQENESFDMEDEDAEEFGNDEILGLKKKTLEDIEKKLEDYNFRGDKANEVTEENHLSKFPIFTTILDFYQNAHFFMGHHSFFKDERFRMNEHSTLRHVGFNEYLDNYSGRKFKDLNESIAKRFTNLGFGSSEGDVNMFHNRYFRVVDANVFEKEFFPAI